MLRSLWFRQAFAGTPTQYPYKPKNTKWHVTERYRKQRFCYLKPGKFMRNTCPLQKQAKVYCVDNSNCRQFYLLEQIDEATHNHRMVPVVVRRVAVLRFKSGEEAQPRQKLIPGTIMYAVVLTRRQMQLRHSGLGIQFDRNTGILLNDKYAPLGTRIMYAAGRHINHRFFLKTAVMANLIV